MLLNVYCSVLFTSRVRVRTRFSFRLVSGYANVFILCCVVVVTLPVVTGG